MTTRDAQWTGLAKPWDLVVVGGGATGAAVLREAVRCGLRALLVEQRDFAWGTSSRSTKLAHGGLRYLDTGDLRLVRESIRERDRLVRESSGLAQRLPFVMTSRPSDGLRHWKSVLGVKLYALLARHWPQAALPGDSLDDAVPGMEAAPGQVFIPYDEATLDDARLVLRLIQEATTAGAVALNQVRVERIERAVKGAGTTGSAGTSEARAPGVEVTLRDRLGERTQTIRATAVVNATGVWAEELNTGAPLRLRPLRGSHLLIPRSRWPLGRAVSFRHPRDRRWVCAVPWEDVVVLGTTDLDHTDDLALEPRVTGAEFDYLLEAATGTFPHLGLSATDVVSCIAGVRSILDEGPGAPSAASRGHLAREERGVVTVTGGKLTNCRQMAHDALALLSSRLPALAKLSPSAPFFDAAPSLSALPVSPELPAATRERLVGRYGPLAAEVAACARPGELSPVGASSTTWAELRWALRHEQMHHLDDLLLRRVRVGLFLPEGGQGVLDRVQSLCTEELGWSEARAREESDTYLALWRRHHAPPHLDASTIR